MNRDEPFDNDSKINVQADAFLRWLAADNAPMPELEIAPDLLGHLPLSPKLIADLGLEATDETGETFHWKADLERQLFGNAAFKARMAFGSNGGPLFLLGDTGTTVKGASR